MYYKIQIKFDYGEIDIYRSWIMGLFLLENRDFKGFWMKIWNAGVSVITRSTFSSLSFEFLVMFIPDILCWTDFPVLLGKLHITQTLLDKVSLFVSDSGLAGLVEPMVWHYLTKFLLPPGNTCTYSKLPLCTSYSILLNVFFVLDLYLAATSS